MIKIIMPLFIVLLLKYNLFEFVNTPDFAVLIVGTIYAVLLYMFYSKLQKDVGDNPKYAINVFSWAIFVVLVNGSDLFNVHVSQYQIVAWMLILSKLCLIYYCARFIEFSFINKKEYILIGVLLLVVALVSVVEILIKIESIIEILILVYYCLIKIGKKYVKN